MSMSRSKHRRPVGAPRPQVPAVSAILRVVAALLYRHRFWVIAAAAILAIGLAFLFVFRDRSVVLAVPKAELDAYAAVMKKLSTQADAPRIRILGFEGNGSDILGGKRPGIAVVSLAPWIGTALDRGDLKDLPAAAFRTGIPAFPRSFHDVIGGAQGAAGESRVRMLPITFDPWLIAWHRDLLGKNNAAPPQFWNDLPLLAKSIRASGASVLALPGKESDADLAWLAILSSGQDQKAAIAAFEKFPKEGREAVGGAFEALAGMQKSGLVQAGSFSYPWSDAIGLLLHRKAAGILLPLSRFRAINPIESAPLIVSRVPDFPGSREYGLLADLRVLVMPARGAAGRGAERAIAYLAQAEIQRALADALGIVPAALDAPIRDGASYAAVDAARNAGALLSPPGMVLDAKQVAAFAAALDKALRSPRDVPSILKELYAGN